MSYERQIGNLLIEEDEKISISIIQDKKNKIYKNIYMDKNDDLIQANFFSFEDYDAAILLFIAKNNLLSDDDLIELNLLLNTNNKYSDFIKNYYIDPSNNNYDLLLQEQHRALVIYEPPYDSRDLVIQEILSSGISYARDDYFDKEFINEEHLPVVLVDFIKEDINETSQKINKNKDVLFDRLSQFSNFIGKLYSRTNDEIHKTVEDIKAKMHQSDSLNSMLKQKEEKVNFSNGKDYIDYIELLILEKQSVVTHFSDLIIDESLLNGMKFEDKKYSYFSLELSQNKKEDLGLILAFKMQEAKNIPDEKQREKKIFEVFEESKLLINNLSKEEKKIDEFIRVKDTTVDNMNTFSNIQKIQQDLVDIQRDTQALKDANKLLTRELEILNRQIQKLQEHKNILEANVTLVEQKVNALLQKESIKSTNKDLSTRGNIAKNKMEKPVFIAKSDDELFEILNEDNLDESIKQRVNLLLNKEVSQDDITDLDEINSLLSIGLITLNENHNYCIKNEITKNNNSFENLLSANVKEDISLIQAELQEDSAVQANQEQNTYNKKQNYKQNARR